MQQRLETAQRFGVLEQQIGARLREQQIGRSAPSAPPSIASIASETMKPTRGPGKPIFDPVNRWIVRSGASDTNGRGRSLGLRIIDIQVRRILENQDAFFLHDLEHRRRRASLNENPAGLWPSGTE